MLLRGISTGRVRGLLPGAVLAVVTLLCLLPLAPPAAAEVKLKIREDGIPFIYNESSDFRERRLAQRFMRLPDDTLLPLIDRHASSQGLNPQLVRAVIQVESGYNPRALSNKGAMGLMQLMPATARELAVADPYDPDENVRGGTTYLRRMLDRFGSNVELALAAYNAGPGAVERHGGVPPFRETLGYVKRVLGLYDEDAGGSGGDKAISFPGRREPFKDAAAAATRAEVTRKAPAPAGPKPQIYITRDSNNRILMTTTPPAKSRRP